MHVFDADTSLAQTAPFHFTGRITPNWSINETPNGGYLMALLTRSMQEVSEKQTTPILTANFLSRCFPGEINLHVEQIGHSNQFSRFQSRLFQNGQENVRMTGTFADKPMDGSITRYETWAPTVARLEDCVQIPTIPGYTLYDQLDVRLDPGHAGWMQGSLIDISELKGWITFRDDRPLDISAIALIADSFPPPVFASQGAVAWVPTIELSIHVRNLPQTQWLKCRFRTRFITCGLLESDGEIWDEEGNLIAISRQIAQFRKIGA
ncbi:MAG: thioesterase family protein [Desulfatirhabdiaceae bacterium]